MPPVFVKPLSYPPQTIIAVPVQTALLPERAVGQFAPVEVAVQVSLAGL
jgi:hypothetical protein